MLKIQQLKEQQNNFFQSYRQQQGLDQSINQSIESIKD